MWSVCPPFRFFLRCVKRVKPYMDRQQICPLIWPITAYRLVFHCLERKRARAPRAPDPRVPSESVARPPRGSALSRRTRAPHRHSHDHMNDSSLWRDGSTRQLPRRSLARGSGRHKHCTCRRGAVWLSAEGAGRRSAKITPGLSPSPPLSSPPAPRATCGVFAVLEPRTVSGSGPAR